MKSLIIIISILLVSFVSFAQTSTGKFLTVSGVSCEVFQGTRGGTYYINSKGNKTYTTPLQESKMGLTEATSQTVVSVPTACEVCAAVAKEKVLIDNGGSTVTFHGVTFQVQTGARGGQFIEYVENGVTKKKYLNR